jgi:hypothetical protein
MSNYIRKVPAIVPQNMGGNLRGEAVGLVRALFPGNLKLLGKGRMEAVSRARQDGGALAAAARMLMEAHAFGASHDELLAVVLWLRSFVDALRKDLDASDEALRAYSMEETLRENAQNVAQMLVANGERKAEAELLMLTIEEMAVEEQMVAVLRKRQVA